LQDTKGNCIFTGHSSRPQENTQPVLYVRFQQEFLKAHNDYGAKHGTPPTLNSELTAAAQACVNHRLAEEIPKHSDTEDGKNVFTKFSSGSLKLTESGKEAVDSWYKEIKDYNWNSAGSEGNTGHFTQVVWKDSTELGVGLATDGKRAVVVGQYRPAGNMDLPGYFEKNVLPLV
ncbi:Golgi-associated plant pathogenesis-related protein 1-like, partial [Anabas testudineus]|uniref:Uncharacterized protein n=1 Tax=Anabas testudineus TaxID=64144 RepID=A0A3Q1I8T1_ANATE